MSSGSETDGSSIDDLKDPGIFDGMKAWFSTSVSQKRKKLWTENDGTIDDWETAMYFFSEDANCEDTKRLYESEDYLNDHLAVVHAIYIDMCVKQRSIKQVALGKYFLPPVEVYEIVRTREKYWWEVLVEEEKENQRKIAERQEKLKEKSPGKDKSPSKKKTTTSAAERTKEQGSPRKRPQDSSEQAAVAMVTSTSKSDSPARKKYHGSAPDHRHSASQESPSKRKHSKSTAESLQSPPKKRQESSRTTLGTGKDSDRQQSNAHSKEQRPMQTVQETSQSSVTTDVSSSRAQNPDRRSPTKRKGIPQYNKENSTEEVIESIHVNDIWWPLEEVTEFIIGQNGCEVFRVK